MRDDIDHEVGPGPLASLWRYKFTSLVIVVVVGYAAAALAVLSPAKPTALARIGLANPRSLSIFLGGGSSGADLGRYAAAQVKFLQGTDVTAAASQQLADGTTAKQMRSEVVVVAAASADVVTITATASSPAEAVRRANAMVSAYQQLTLDRGKDALQREQSAIATEKLQLTNQITAAKGGSALSRATVSSITQALQQLEQDSSDAQTQAALFGSGTEFVDAAIAQPRKTAVSRAIRNGALGAVVGLILAGAVGWIRAGRRREIDTADDAAHLLGAPVLGEVPAIEARQRVERLEDPAASPLAVFHGIATALGAVSRTGLFLVVGANRNDGRSTTTMGLAAALAADGTRVAVVDADLRTGRLSKLYRLAAADAGLAELARGEVELLDVVYRLDAPDGGDVNFVGAGRPVPEPAGLLRTADLAEGLRQLRSSFDVVLVDTPALGITADALALARNASGVITVVRRRTAARPLRDLREQIGVNGVPVMGLVLTFAAGRRGGIRGYGPRGTQDVGTDALETSEIRTARALRSNN